MPLETLQLDHFTLFDQLEMHFSDPGINVLIGANATGKTHILKAGYALCSAPQALESRPASQISISEIELEITKKLIRVFLPLDNKLGNLHRHHSEPDASLHAMVSFDRKVSLRFNAESESIHLEDHLEFDRYSWKPLFIPSKEVLSFMKGFTSLYQSREVGFDQTYADLCYALDSPKYREHKLPEPCKNAMENIREICNGTFLFHGGGNITFQSNHTELAVNTTAEGFRKLGILYRLLETGSLIPLISGPLFWDEPESNLNPSLIKALVQILLDLSRKGQQIILATHSYVLLKWLDLLSDPERDKNIHFHCLYRDKATGIIRHNSTDRYLDIHPNTITDTFSDLYDREVERSFIAR